MNRETEIMFLANRIVKSVEIQIKNNECDQYGALKSVHAAIMTVFENLNIGAKRIDEQSVEERSIFESLKIISEKLSQIRRRDDI